METLKEFLKKDDALNDILQAIEEKRFMNLYKDENEVGFLTWYPVTKDSQLWIYIGNMYIYKQYRNTFNIATLRGILRKKFPGARAVWNRDKKGYVYAQ